MVSQQYRYMLVMVIVLLTIFIYVIYSSNEMQVPGRIHTSVSVESLGVAESLEGNDIHHNDSFSTNSSKIRSNNDELEKHLLSVIQNTSHIENVTTSSTSKPQSSSSQVAQQPKAASPQNVSLPASLPTAAPKKNQLPNEPKSQNSKPNSNVTQIVPAAPRKAGPLDASNGIKTSEFYELGHIESNSEICPELGGPLRLVILITSAPSHQEARLSIRQTWGHYGIRRDVGIAFMLGKTQDPVKEEQLDQEHDLYGDLIRGHFIDSYNNLTLKTISLLEWVDTYCSKASFILKTDDDMFINVPKLLMFIEKRSKDTRTIYGRLAKKWKPIRNKKSKYYVSTKQYYPPVFPQFTTGPAYLMTSDCVHDLYTKSLNQTYLKLEDVFTTGIVAHLSNIKRVHVNEFFNRRIVFNPCNVKKAISIHMVKSNEQFDLWKKLQDPTTKCK